MRSFKQLLILFIIIHKQETYADTNLRKEYVFFVEYSYYNSEIIELTLTHRIQSKTSRLSSLNKIMHDIKNKRYSTELNEDFYQRILSRHNMNINRSNFSQNIQYHDELLNILSNQKNKILKLLNNARYALFKKHAILIGIYDNITTSHKLGANLSIGNLNSLFLLSNKNKEAKELIIGLFDQYHMLKMRNSSIYIKPQVEFKLSPNNEQKLYSELILRNHYRKKKYNIMRDTIVLAGKSITNKNVFYAIGHNISISNLIGDTLSLYTKYSLNNTDDMIYNKTLYNKISYNLHRSTKNYNLSLSLGFFREESLQISHMSSSGIIFSLCCTI